MMAHAFSVEFRIVGKDLNLDQVSKDLGLAPSFTALAGMPMTRGASRIRDESVWGFDGSEQRGTTSYWTSLEEGLSFVMELLQPRLSVILSYKDGASLIWWCAHFQQSFDGGFILSPLLLARLAEFEAPLFVDNYFSSEKPDTPIAALR